MSPSAKGFSRYLSWNFTIKKGYLVYVPSTRNIISSYDVFLNESFASELAYTSQSYSEAMALLPSMTYTPYDSSSKEQTQNIITSAQFE